MKGRTKEQKKIERDIAKLDSREKRKKLRWNISRKFEKNKSDRKEGQRKALPQNLNPSLLPHEPSINSESEIGMLRLHGWLNALCFHTAYRLGRAGDGFGKLDEIIFDVDCTLLFTATLLD